MMKADLKEFREKIGWNLARLRIAKNWTIKDLAERVSISERKLSGYEIGRHNVNLQVLYRLALVLNCQMDEFF